MPGVVHFARLFDTGQRGASQQHKSRGVLAGKLLEKRRARGCWWWSLRCMSSARIASLGGSASRPFFIAPSAAYGDLFEYNTRETVVYMLLGEARANWLWRQFKLPIKSLLLFMWLLGSSLTGVACLVSAPPLEGWGVACLAYALSVPATLQYYAFLNLPLLKKSLRTFEALFLILQVAVTCVGEAGTLGWNAYTLHLFGVAFPGYFTIVTSDACHRALRSRLVIAYMCSLLYCGALAAIIITKSGDDTSTILDLWGFQLPLSRMAFTSIMTLAVLISKIVYRFARHPDQLTILYAPLVIIRSADRGAWVDSALSALKAAVALGGGAELRMLAKRLEAMHAALVSELAAARPAQEADQPPLDTGQPSYEV